LNGIAKENVISEIFTDSKGNPVFFVSIDYLATKYGKTPGKTANRLGILAYLGLINKLSESEIPEHFLREARHQAALKKHKNIISFYSIPSYCYSSLSFSEEKAKEFKKKHLSVKGWSREMILRVLGKKEADRVYPQMEGKKISEFNERISRQMEKVALRAIKKKGWTTEKEIINRVNLTFKGQKRFKECQIKKILGEMIDKYDLSRQKLTKHLIEKYKINTKNYFYIIHDQSNLGGL